MKLNLNIKKFLIFDLDDTILMTRQAKYKALQYCAKKFYKFDLKDEVISKYWGRPFPEFMNALFRGYDPLPEIINNYYSILADFPVKAYPEVIDTLDLLKKKYRLGIVSAISKELLLLDLISAGIDKGTFEYIQVADDTKIHKPDPGVFAPLLSYVREQGLTKQDLVYIGDALTDFQAAKYAGIDFIGVSGRSISSAEFEKAGADRIDSLTGLLSLETNRGIAETKIAG
jgi:HAD superfamily hydrolase (TIGR01549 family)